MNTKSLFSLGVLAITLPLAVTAASARPAASVVIDADQLGRSASRAPTKDLRLKPNEYRWYAGKVEAGPVEVVMSLADQRAYAFRSGELLGVATISSGKEGKTSPYGRFQILEKKRMHRSIRYDNAPMPWMMRLNWYGVAMHAGHNPGYPASHGCIRLPSGFAQKLFAIAQVGSFVYVTPDPLHTPEDALEAARANYTADMPESRLPRGGQAEDYAEGAGSTNETFAEDALSDSQEPGMTAGGKPRGLLHRTGGSF